MQIKIWISDDYHGECSVCNNPIGENRCHVFDVYDTNNFKMYKCCMTCSVVLETSLILGSEKLDNIDSVILTDEKYKSLMNFFNGKNETA